MPHDSPPLPVPDSAFLVRVKFDSAVLVCGDCEKRSSGPTRLSARDVRKDLKHQLAGPLRRFRIVQTSCLGICPKKAIAVVALPAGMALTAGALKSGSDVAGFASLILKPA